MTTQFDISEIPEITLSYNMQVKASDRPHVSHSQEAYILFCEHWSDQIGVLEEFNMLLLDNARRAMGISNVAKGGITQVSVDIRLCFATALKARASAIILAHNHPSGQLRPSSLDLTLTEKFKEAGALLNIKILDHLILSPHGDYYSFMENDLL